MVKNKFMIKELLQNEAFVSKLETIVEELNLIKENKSDFSFFLPKFIINMEGLLKMYHPEGSNTFDYASKFESTKEEKIKLQEEKKQHFETIAKAMELYKRIEVIDANLSYMENDISSSEWKIWKDGHEGVTFETVKNYLNKND
jgi:hypothetical protein